MLPNGHHHDGKPTHNHATQCHATHAHPIHHVNHPIHPNIKSHMSHHQITGRFVTFVYVSYCY